MMQKILIMHKLSYGHLYALGVKKYSVQLYSSTDTAIVTVVVLYMSYRLASMPTNNKL